MPNFKINSQSLTLVGFLWLIYFIYLSAVLISLDQANFQSFFHAFVFIDIAEENWLNAPWVIVSYSLFHNSLAMLLVHSALLLLLMNGWKYSMKLTLVFWFASAIVGGFSFMILESSGMLIGPSFVISVLAPLVYFQNQNSRNRFVELGILVYLLSFLLEIYINGFGISSQLHVVGLACGFFSTLILVFLSMSWFNRFRMWIGIAPKLHVKQKNPRFKSDEEFNQERKLKGEYLDFILDKISRSGYESLSKAERKFLDENRDGNG